MITAKTTPNIDQRGKRKHVSSGSYYHKGVPKDFCMIDQSLSNVHLSAAVADNSRALLPFTSG